MQNAFKESLLEGARTVLFMSEKGFQQRISDCVTENQKLAVERISLDVTFRKCLPDMGRTRCPKNRTNRKAHNFSFFSIYSIYSLL